MKKILSLIATIALVFTSCDPLEDIYTEVGATISSEELVNGVTGHEVITLAEEDYEAMNITENVFTSKQQVKDSVPAYLSELYPTYGSSSSVEMTYQVFAEVDETLEAQINADYYDMAEGDYPAEGTSAFYPSDTLSKYIPLFLSANDGVEGELRKVGYNIYSGGEVRSTVYEENFNNLSNTTTVNLEGDITWEASERDDDTFAQINAFNGGNRQVSNDWLISNEIDLVGKKEAEFHIKQLVEYANNESDLDNVKIMVSEDYDGDVSNATWIEIILEKKPDVDNDFFEWVESEAYDLSAFDGKKIHFAFQYASTIQTTVYWRIDEFKVTAIQYAKKTKIDYYVYDGTNWKIDDSNVYMLSADDYDSMGTSSGQPGKHNNFASDVLPADYLPIFLSKMFDYPIEGDKINLVYKFWNGTISTRGKEYIYTNSIWTPAADVLTDIMKFEHDGSDWIPVEIIEYTMTADDYTNIGSNYSSLPEFSDVEQSLFDNLKEYGNFGYVWVDNLEKEWDQETNLAYPILQYFLTQLIADYPDAKPGQKLRLTFSYYSYGNKTVTQEFIMNEDGGFDFETAPVIVQQ